MDNISKQRSQSILPFYVGIHVYINVLFVLQHLNKLFIFTFLYFFKNKDFFFHISLECFQFVDISKASLVLINQLSIIVPSIPVLYIDEL